jgi:hypothetical protein
MFVRISTRWYVFMQFIRKGVFYHKKEFNSIYIKTNFYDVLFPLSSIVQWLYVGIWNSIAISLFYYQVKSLNFV